MHEDLDVVLDGLTKTDPVVCKKIDEEYVLAKKGE